MGILRKGNGTLTPIPRNSEKQERVTNDRPFYWNTVKHSDLGDNTGAPVKTIKLSKEEIDKLYPRSKNSMSQDELSGLLKKGLSLREIANKSGIAKDRLVEIAKGYGMAGKMSQNSEKDDSDYGIR